MHEISLADVPGLVGQELGTSKWITVDQRMINLFADATHDHQFIHVDPERAAAESYGKVCFRALRASNFVLEVARSCAGRRTHAPTGREALESQARSKHLDRVEIQFGVKSALAISGMSKPVPFSETRKHPTGLAQCRSAATIARV